MEVGINRKELKAKAKELAFNNKMLLWKPILTIFLISVAISFVSGVLIGFLGLANSIVAAVIQLAISLFSMIFTVAEVAYVLKFVRGEKNLDIIDIIKSKIKILVPVLIANIVVVICTGLWSLLFVIPGIIYSLKVIWVNYIFADDETENIDWGAAIKRSKTMMDGYKVNYLIFGLSFIGWSMACALVIPMIWVIPYFTVANAMYFEELKKIKQAELAAP